jgi:queuine tRNA-ribosyltransferase
MAKEKDEKVSKKGSYGAESISVLEGLEPVRKRPGMYIGTTGPHQIKNNEFKNSSEPLMKNCRCYACQTFETGYIRHLFIENEILAHRLITIHNLTFLVDLMRNIRETIEQGTFQSFKKKFLKKFLSPTS